jgi:hypothetical protein
MTTSIAIPSPFFFPIVAGAPLIAPTALDCLGCQLLGRRKLLCSRADACREMPHVSALGPVLLVGWLAMLVAFIVAVL